MARCPSLLRSGAPVSLCPATRQVARRRVLAGGEARGRRAVRLLHTAATLKPRRLRRSDAGGMNQQSEMETRCSSKCDCRGPAMEIRQAESRRYFEILERMVLPLTVQHLACDLSDRAARHDLALSPLQGKCVIRIGAAISHRDDELIRAGIVTDRREGIREGLETQHRQGTSEHQSDPGAAHTKTRSVARSSTPWEVRLHHVQWPTLVTLKGPYFAVCT